MRPSRRRRLRWVSPPLAPWAKLSDGIECDADCERLFAASWLGLVPDGGLSGTFAARPMMSRKRFWTLKWNGYWTDATDDPGRFVRV